MKTPKIKCHLPWILNYQKKKKLLTIISKSPFLVSYMHSYVSTPPLSIFSPSPKTNRKRLLSINLFYILYISISLFFSPCPSLSFAQKKKKKIQQTRDGMGFQERRMRMTTFSFQRTTFCFHNDLGRFLAICSKILWGRNWQTHAVWPRLE